MLEGIGELFMIKQNFIESVRKYNCKKVKMRRVIAVLLCFTISFTLMQSEILFANSKKDNVKLQMTSASSADTNFLLYSYMVNYYLNTGKIVDATESMFLDISPSRLLYKEGQKEGTDQAAKLWKQFMNVVGAVDKPSSVVDAVLEKKNIYSGLLFSICQCSYDKYTINKLDTTMAKNANTVYSLLKEGMITEYSIDFANSVSISKLSEDEKKFLSELTNEIVEDDFGTTGEVMEALGDELEVIGGINTIGDWCNYVANCIALNEINEGTKQIIREMYEICPDSNASLKGALYDCLDIINANELDMIAHLSTYVGGQMTKDAAQDLVDTYYGNLKNAAIANNPYIGLIWLAYKGSKLLTNTVFKSDDISEKYCKLEAILDIRDLAYQVYLTEKANFEGDDSEQNAQVLMASINFMFQCMQEDCNCAQSYVETIDEAFCEKVKIAFGCSNGPEIIKDIKSIKNSISSVWRTATLEWIYDLEEDFPTEYERYSYLLPKSVSLGKSKITIYVGQTITIPVDSREILNWTSSKNSVASVNENGKITGKKAGTSIITASAGDVSDTCTVTVKKSTIKLNKSKVTIKQGKSTDLKATVKGASNKVTWTTSDTTIATVSSTGKVTGKKAGTVTITATANGVSAKCKITITVQNMKEKALIAYAKFLSQETLQWGDNEYYNAVPTENCKFSIIYLDNNDIPELILYNADDITHIAGRGVLYTYKNEKVTFVGGFQLDDKVIYWNKSGIFSSSYIMTGAVTTYFDFSNDKIIEKLEMYLRYEDIGKKKVSGYGEFVESDLKDITKKEFDGKLKKLVGNGKLKTAKFYSNTKTNRSKYLK